MSNNQRLAMAVVTVAVLVVAFVVLRSGGGSDDDEMATATIVRTVVAETTPAGSTTTKTVQEKPQKPKSPLVVVRGGEPAGGVQKLEFRKGDTIDFRVRSDTPGEIHFHGYDVHRDIPQGGGTVRFKLPAKFDGRFEVEVEATGVQIAQVEVQP